MTALHAPSPLTLAHLGYAGLRIAWGDQTLSVDAPEAVADPLIVTWTERERILGARSSSGLLGGDPALLAWLHRDGVPLLEGATTRFGPYSVRVRRYRPIPYATPPEAVRKVLSTFRGPARSARRLAFTLRRPASAPLAVTIDHGGSRVVLLGQALHRFVDPEGLAGLVAWAGPSDLVVAGTDYEDEVATGTMLGAFAARIRVVADLTGTIRRALGLPVRPLNVAAGAAPAGTRRLGPGDHVRVT